MQRSRRPRGRCLPAGRPRGGAAPLPRAEPRGSNTRRDAGQPTRGSLPTRKKTPAGSKPAGLLGCCYKPRRRFARRSRRGARQSRSPRRPAPGDAPGGMPAGRGGEESPGVVQSRSASCCPAAARAQLPLPKVAARGGGADGLPPPLASARRTAPQAGGSASRGRERRSARGAVLQPWWRKAFPVRRRGS